MLNTRFAETRMFKEVPGGFIFQLPTIFTPTEAVLVTASQRDEILAITRKGSTWHDASSFGARSRSES